MAPTQPSPESSTREQMIVEAWAQGLNVGAIVILILLVLCNYRHKALLHKLVLSELLLALGHGFFAFFQEPEFGWVLSSTAALLYISYFVHNVIAWLKIRPFLPKWGSRVFIISLLAVQPFWVLETWANFQYHNNLGSKLLDTSRLFEPLARDPWWVFTTIKLVLAINDNYEFTIPKLVRISPRFGVMLLCLFVSIVFVIVDVIFMILVSKRGGLNPFWRLALIFKCASDVIFLDDFKSVLDRISESAMRKIATFSYRDDDNHSQPTNQNRSTPGLPGFEFRRKSSRPAAYGNENGCLQGRSGSCVSAEDGHYEYATSYDHFLVEDSSPSSHRGQGRASEHGDTHSRDIECGEPEEGPCKPTEVEAMQYVASHTSIPVPRIYAVHTEENGSIYIEMAYVRGDGLDSAWSRLSVDEKNTVFADIKQQVSCLRELQPPTQDIVSSALQNPAFDCRIGACFYGPLNQDEFHSLARGHLRMEDVAPFLGPEVAKVHTSHYKTHFTHADLAPRNIIVRHGRVVAIIDWEFAGWYPEYWEFTKAYYNCFPDDEWEDYLRIALPCYDTELVAEQTLWARLPEPGTKTSSYRDGVWVERQGSSPSKAWLDARAGRKLTDLWSLALS
ncbi:Non-specific serine/threonine protein kinase [Fusarium sp. LHS14.1]|nr:Non-specific serine/threonine protein kinase [Fusarium sp. LHS14.1]